MLLQRELPRSSSITGEGILGAVSSLPFATKIVKEGCAELVVPETSEQLATTRLPAFYNPLSKVSRDIAVLATNAYFSGSGSGTVAEPLAGTGARVIRLLLESGVFSEAVAGDISEWAVKLMKINVERNGLGGRVSIERSDANLLLSRLATEDRASYVDIDPFGSPVKFLENGFRATGRRGLIGVSATDLAALSGSSRRTALWRYGLTLVKTSFFKEVAIRALTAVAAMTAARLGLGAEPILSVAYRHFVRVFLSVDKGRRKAYEAAAKVGYLVYCRECLNTFVMKSISNWTEKCSLCGGSNAALGPIWTGKLYERSVLEKILASKLAGDPTYEEAMKLFMMLVQEPEDVPWSFQLAEVSRRARTSPPKSRAVVDRLRELGYRASITHYDRAAIKTDAPANILLQLVRELAGK